MNKMMVGILFLGVEIFSLVFLGARLGFGLAVLWMLSSGFLGSLLLKRGRSLILSGIQGQGKDLQLQPQESGEDTSDLSALSENISKALGTSLAGILLMIPFFFSDLLGLLLLIGPVRRRLFRFNLQNSFGDNVMFQSIFTGGAGFSGGSGTGKGPIIDGESHTVPSQTLSSSSSSENTGKS